VKTRRGTDMGLVLNEGRKGEKEEELSRKIGD